MPKPNKRTAAANKANDAKKKKFGDGATNSGGESLAMVAESGGAHVFLPSKSNANRDVSPGTTAESGGAEIYGISASNQIATMQATMAKQGGGGG
uniref:Uncharacterized protein n=1 Tax=Ditylenchus dipsaci TaxID=166011 RepID=A0A915DWK9_9BILA